MTCPHCQALVQGNSYIMKFFSPCWMYKSLLSSLPLWSNYTKSEKQSASKAAVNTRLPRARCWGWQPQEVTSLHSGYLLILQTVISLPTLPFLVALHLILEKNFYVAQVGAGAWYLFDGTSLPLHFGKKGHFHAIHWHCLWILFLHFPCTFYERLRELFVGGKIFSWVSVWFTIVLLVRLISCLMTKKIASHNSLTFHHLISGLVSLHNF